MNEASIEKRLTSKDIARLAGVSQTTVSRVLQDLPSVKPETREQVLAVIRSHNYHPSAAARWMKTSRTNSVAVVVARLSNPLYPLLLHHVSEELRNQGLLMSVWESIPGFEDRLLRAIGEGAVDGVLSATATERDAPLLRRLRQQRPVVLLNRTLADDSFDQVSSDNHAGAAAVASHFIAKGRRRPALITGPILPSTIREREKGYRDTLASVGLQPQDAQVLRAKDFTYRCGYDAAQALAMQAPESDGIFCTNDVLAIGACDGLRAMGKRVPEDIWVVGYDDIEMASWAAISLSTMRQPHHQMAHMAVQKLAARVHGYAGPGASIRLHNEFVLRSSSG